MKRIFLLLATAGLLASCTQTDPIVVDTFRGNPISGNLPTHVTAAGGPYLATDTLKVPAGQTTTIEPGTEIRFEPGIPMVVYGRIDAVGSEFAPIIFTSGAKNPTRGDWDGIWLMSADNSSAFKYCKFLFGAKFGRRYTYWNTDTGELDSARVEYGCLTLKNTSPSIERCWFIASGYHGLQCDPGSEPTVKNCVFFDNAGHGIYIDQNANPHIKYSIISENDDYGVYCGMPGEDKRDDVDVSYNIVIENFSGEFNQQAPLRMGRIAGANGNLDSCDYHFNLRMNPEYVAAGKIKNGASWDFRLNPWSFGIDAGPVDADLDGDGTRRDFGVHPYIYRTGELRRLFTRPILTVAESPYILSSNIYLPAGQQLAIEPGVDIQVEGRFQIRIKGRLLASGSDARPIEIYSGASEPARGDWVGIIFDYSDPGCVLSHTNISHARWGVKLIGTDIFIDNCEVSHSDSVGVFCDNISSPRIFDSRFEENSIAGILCRFNSSPIIRGNFISGSQGYGIHAVESSRPVIQNNAIYNNGTNGIRLENLSNALVENNVFSGNGYFGLFCSNNSSPEVRNNVFHRNGSNLRGGMGIYAQESSLPRIEYNDFWGNAVTAVSISSDTTLNMATNIITDPQFVDEAAGNFHLKPGSHCIDAGDPAVAYNDTDGSRNDMGMFGGPNAR